MRRVLVPTLLILFAEISGCSDQPVEASLAITDVTVIDGTDAPPILHATILIQGNRIADIRTGRVALSPDTPTLDGTGKYVIPGLWEMHMHVSLLEGPAILPVFTVYGITGVRDMGSPDSIFDIREELARGQRVGPRLLSAGLAFVNYDTPEGHPEPWAQGLTAADGASDAVERLVGRADFVKIQDSFTERDVWLAIAREADRHNLPLAGHIPFGLNLEEAIENGLTSIEHSLGLAAAFTNRESELRGAVMAQKESGDPWSAMFKADATAMQEIDDERVKTVAALMIAHGVVIDANLKDLESMSYAASGKWHQDPRLGLMDPKIGESWIQAADSGFFDETNTANLRATFEKMPALIGRLQDLGVTIIAGTDAGAMFDFPGSDLHNELGLLVGGGMTPLEAIQSATRDAAWYMGISDSLGTVQKGYLADLVLLDASPLEDISNTAKVAAVVQNGKLYDRSALNAMLVELTERTAPGH